MSDSSLFGGNVSLCGLRICLALGVFLLGLLMSSKWIPARGSYGGAHEYVVPVDSLQGLGVLESSRAPFYRIRLTFLTFLV